MLGAVAARTRADQARHRGAGAAAAQPGGGGQGARQPRRDLGRPPRPRRGRGLVRARVRRGGRALQAARPALRAQPRHPDAALDRGPRHAQGGRVQPARGGDGAAHRAAPAPARPDRRLRGRGPQAGRHRGRRLAHLLLHARELHALAGRRCRPSPARRAATRPTLTATNQLAIYVGKNREQTTADMRQWLSHRVGHRGVERVDHRARHPRQRGASASSSSARTSRRASTGSS